MEMPYYRMMEHHVLKRKVTELQRRLKNAEKEIQIAREVIKDLSRRIAWQKKLMLESGTT